MNFLLEITPDQYGDKIIETAGLIETLGFGGMIVLIGMLTIFTVLLLILGALLIFKLVFHDSVKKKPSTIIEDKPVQSPVTIQSSNDEEIIAVLAAAIAMAESSDINTKFRVVSFRKR